MGSPTQAGGDQEAQVDVDSDDVEETDETALARALGFDVTTVTQDAANRDVDALLAQLGDRDVDPVVATILESLVKENRRLRERVEDLEKDQEANHDVATTAVAKAQTNESRVDDLEEQETQTREIARSAIAKANQVDADQQEDAEDLPHGVEPSTSPLDFFANCREEKIKEVFVEQSNQNNTFRAVKVAKRTLEFAHERNDGSGFFWTREDVDRALTAVLGKQPHRETRKRVWSKLIELGSDDLKQKYRQVGRTQEKTEIISISRDTAERLLEKRYIGMDLLDGSNRKAATGGVTPVVTGGAA